MITAHGGHSTNVRHTFRRKGGKDLNRLPRFGSLCKPAHGWIRLAVCNTCGHRDPLPVERMVRKHGELALVEFVMNGLRCTECGGLEGVMYFREVWA